MMKRSLVSVAIVVFARMVLGCSTAGSSSGDGSGSGGGAGTGNCAAPLAACGGACVDVTLDAANCGLCGNVCASGSSCVNGACACSGGGASCGGQCVDSSMDVLNCGGCGSACGSGQTCAAGACQCQAGLTNCATGCVDTTENADHCGACAAVCALDQVCSLGTCAAGCAAGTMQCGRSCADLASSVFHCGACDNACPAGQSCSGGQCSCPAGQSFCDGQCRDLSGDELNCGTCGTVCSGECVNGTCPAGKVCATKTALSAALVSDFETYNGTQPVSNWGFSFNAASGQPGAVYGGLYEYNDGTGMPLLDMAAGNGSDYGARISNSLATAWGGALGVWMGCIDASGFDGISFAVRGPVPTGTASLTLAMEQTSPPDANEAAQGGTCASGCVAPAAEFPVSSSWTRIFLPWSQFTPGTADQASIPANGDNVTGLTFTASLNWVEDPGNAGTYVPQASAYELAVDDIQLFNSSESCPSGQQICNGTCVDAATNASHCGSCGRVCTAGQTCSGGACVCPGGGELCAGACVDTQTNTSHCGDCGNFCPIGSTCSGGQCSGTGNTSNRCGTSMQRLGSPFGCQFAWGANPSGAIPSYLDFASKWVGYEQNINTTCDGCAWLQSFGSSSVVPLYIAYFIAYRANIEGGLGDCNTDSDGQNLCSHGAQWIRDNRARILSIYQSYAQRSYAAFPNQPVIWLIDPDFIQYTYAEQTNELSMTELGQLASDVVCTVKANMPNAVIAFNHSTWIREPTYSSYWSAMPLDLIDLVHTTGVANITGGYFNSGDANNRVDGTYAYLRQKTGRPLLVDTSFGVSTQTDTWSTTSAATLDARIADGVAGVLINPTPSNYQTRITTLTPQLDSTCP